MLARLLALVFVPLMLLPEAHESKRARRWSGLHERCELLAACEISRPVAAHVVLRAIRIVDESVEDALVSNGIDSDNALPLNIVGAHRGGGRRRDQCAQEVVDSTLKLGSITRHPNYLARLIVSIDSE